MTSIRPVVVEKWCCIQACVHVDVGGDVDVDAGARFWTQRATYGMYEALGVCTRISTLPVAVHRTFYEILVGIEILP
jgi:hypothetical protein